MPAHKKKHTTPDSHLTTTEATAPSLPGHQELHDHLRTLIRGATRVVMEEIMQEELSLFLRAAWGESPPSRQGTRLGSYTRDLVTATGRIEDLSVPRDREGQVQTQAFERYSRYEPQVAAAFTEMFVSGTSTQKVGEVTKTLLGVTPSASTVSRLNQSLTEQFDAWRVRPLQQQWRIGYLDGIHFTIGHGKQCDFTATPRQRCLVHKQRHILNAIPRREREEVQAELVGIWKQDKKEDALINLAVFPAKYAQRYPEAVRSLMEDQEHLLTFYAFPSSMHRHIQTTNAIESFLSNVRQRTDQIDALTTQASCLSIVWALMQAIHFHKVAVS